MTFYVKKRKSKTSKRKKTKRKLRQNKKTRKFKKQYGGRLNEQQIIQIKKQLKALNFSEEDIKDYIYYFNEISQPLSKPLRSNPNKTLLDTFFENLKANYQHNPRLTQEEKQDIFIGLLSRIHNKYSQEEPDTDDEDNY